MPGSLPAHTRVCCSVVLLCASCLLAGCGGRGEDAEAISRSARHLAAVGSASVEGGPYTYASVSQELGGLEKGSGTSAGIAAGLLAQSTQGQGSLEAGKAMLADRALFDEINEARSLSLRYMALTTTSASLASFDPSGDIAEITQEADALAQQAEQRREDRARLAEEIGRLEARVASLESDSGAKREQAAQMKLAAASMSAVDAAKLAGDIRTITRQADALDMEANRIKGQIETLRPRLAEIDGDVGKLDEQRQLALDFADELRAKQQTRNEKAVKLRADAASVAQRINALVSSISDQREKNVIPAGDEAISLFERAIRASGKAGRVDRISAQLSKSAAQRRLAETLHLRGQGFGRFAALLDELASASPPMPESETYAAMAQKQHAAEQDALAKAADMYEQTASTLQSSGVRGPERDRIASVASEFEALAARLRGEPTAATEPAEPGAGENPDEDNPEP